MNHRPKYQLSKGLPELEMGGAVVLLEGVSLNRVGWTSCLGISQEEFDELVDARVLKVDDESGGYLLNFVGLVVFQNSLLFAQPKFSEVKPLPIGEVFRVLRTYFGRSSLRRPSVDKPRDPEYGNAEVLREFDALLGLKEWFLARGVYRQEQTRAGSRGRPHWVKTIAKRSPVLIQGSAIYPSVVAECREGVLNEVSALQVGVLRLLLERYGLEVPSALVHADWTMGRIFAQWPLPEDQRGYYLRRLELEQRDAFRTDTLHLLKLLKEILDSRAAAAMPRAQIYGTTAFYAVWEDAIRAAVQDQAVEDPVTMIGQPVWWTRNLSKIKTKCSMIQIPDVVVVQDTSQIIIDAKYYYPFPRSRPGAPDVVKQLYYMESIREPSALVLSIFLLPTPGALEPTFLGYATVEGAQRPFGNIEAWGIDPGLLLSRYVATSASGHADLIAPILIQRERVAKFVDKTPPSIGG